MELLERAHILDELRRLLSIAGDGQGSLLLLGGEAGVGKTSVLRAFIAEVRASARVLLGHCDALSTPRPLGPLFDIADDLLSSLLAENASRDAIFRAVLARLTNRGQPTLIAIEDAHWADEATLDLLRYLGRRVDATGALAVVSYRNDEVGPRHPLRRVLGDLATATAVHRLDLAPLTLDAVAALAADRGIDPLALHDRTRGNPFFVTEILAAGGEFPDTVRDAVLARASRLGPAAWQVLEAAAVIGSPIDVDVLYRVSKGAPSDVDACLGIGMLIIDGTSMRFRHELAREAILTSITPPRRAILHREVLSALETAREQQYSSARLAHHAEEAGDAAAVMRYAPEAAHRATRLRAYREAASQYERALRFAEALLPEERAQLFEARAYACYFTAQIDQAVAARTAALAIWNDVGDQRKAGENRCHLATLFWAQAKIADAEREAEGAVALLEQHPPGPELAMAYGTLARLGGASLEREDAISLGDKAIALAARGGTTETLIDALMTVGEARLARGDIEAGQQQIELGMRRALDAGLDELTARAFICLGFGFAESGRLVTATDHFERGIRFCEERDLDLPLHHMTALLASCHCSLGHWDEALRLAKSVLNAREVAPASRFEALWVMGVLMIRRGETGAEAILDEALEIASTSGCIVYMGPVRAARAEAAFLTGKSSESAEEARASYDLALQRGYRWYVGELAYWQWKSGEPAASPGAFATPFALQITGDWERAAAAWDARKCPYEAARARAESRDEAALRLALETFDRLGARPAATAVRRTLRELGALHVPRGPRPETRTHPAGMTAREADVLEVLASGCSNQEIAERLFLSPRTVENHVAAILDKLGATTRSEAATTARQLGLIT